MVGDAHRGFTVVEADSGSTEENFQIGAALESLGAALAAPKIDDEGLAKLTRLNDRMRDLAEDDATYPELNREFHFTLYEYAHSPLLLSLMRLLWQALHGGPRVTRSRAESIEQHEQIIDALRAGDSEAARKVTCEHIMGAVPVD